MIDAFGTSLNLVESLGLAAIDVAAAALQTSLEALHTREATKLVTRRTHLDKRTLTLAIKDFESAGRRFRALLDGMSDEEKTLFEEELRARVRFLREKAAKV